VRWPWRRERDESARKAAERIAAAQEREDAADAAEPRVSRVARQLERLRKENQFGPRLLAAFKDDQ
jgi:hypothetical protein